MDSTKNGLKGNLRGSLSMLVSAREKLAILWADGELSVGDVREVGKIIGEIRETLSEVEKVEELFEKVSEHREKLIGEARV